MSVVDVSKLKRVAVIGATGSVGTSVLDVCRSHRDRVGVRALAANSRARELAALAAEFGADMVCLADIKAAGVDFGKDVKVVTGSDGLLEIVRRPDVDHVVFASSGTAAIEALQEALRLGKEVSLANKESIVVAGQWVMPLVQRSDQLRPLDSEHNAVWQCLQGESSVPRKIYLTASGGPFRAFSMDELRTVTPEMALNHPVWSMGAKITVDSATLMNKGIELIEASYLFGLAPEQVDALVSPGSFVHGMVEFEDGCVKMLAGVPDMRTPASSCLFWPERLLPMEKSPRPLLDAKNLTFDLPDEKRFPAIRLAREALRAGGAYPALLVGADEVAVERFLRKELSFINISAVVEETMASYNEQSPGSLADALAVLQWSRRRCADLCDAKNA